MGGVSAAWEPSDRATLLVDLDSRAGTGGTSDGDAVTTWADQTANANSPTQGSATLRPLYRTNRVNGLPSVLFDGSNDRLLDAAFTAGAISQPYTMTLVYRHLAAGANVDYLIVNGSGTEATLFSPATSSRACDERWVSATTQRSIKSADYDWHALILEVNGASSRFKLDNKPWQSMGNPGTGTLTGLSLGAYWEGSGPSNVEFARVLVDTAVLGSDEAKMTTYLNSTYGINATADGYAVVDGGSNWNAFPGCVKLASGDLLTVYRRAAGHVGSKGTIYQSRSTDGGTTWGTPAEILTDATLDLRDPVGAVQLASGRILLPYFAYPVSGTPLSSTQSRVAYSDDNGTTWAALSTISTPAGYTALFIWGHVRELTAGGDLIVPAYALNTTSGKYDSVLLKSTNGGTTWALHGVIAAGTATPRDYTETDVVVTTSVNNLYAVIREDNGQLLYTSTTTDGGATGSAIGSSLVNGVAPSLLRMASGNLVLCWADRNVGPFGVSAMKSTDHGATWSAWRYRVWHRVAGEDMGYCAPVELSAGIVGTPSYLDSTGTQATIRWDTFREASLQ